MIARITPYKLKPSSIDVADKMVAQMKEDILALPGLVQFINVHNADGSGYVVSIIESLEAVEQNRGIVDAIWSRFDAHFEGLPVSQSMDVQSNWTV